MRSIGVTPSEQTLTRRLMADNIKHAHAVDWLLGLHPVKGMTAIHEVPASDILAAILIFDLEEEAQPAALAIGETIAQINIMNLTRRARGNKKGKGEDLPN